MPEVLTEINELPSHDIVAAVDLGSNSFHMIVARLDEGHMRITDRIREVVRLGEGLTPEKTLTPEVSERALSCLERFGQRLRGFAPGSVRAVGTNTLRQLRPETGFVERAELALGHPIDVIAGREEARLIYLGVAHGLAAGTERRLVVDIGGGSTEIIVGQGFSSRLRESLHLGCVSLSRQAFADGRITAKAMQKAELAGALEVRPVRELFRRARWQQAVGCSGTIRAIAAVVNAEGWCDNGISAESLAQLSAALTDAGRVATINLKGLPEERKPVFAGGVAILRAVFEALGITHMQVSDYALREGLIYEMMGRSQHEDVRERTVATLCQQFQTDLAHARRVEATALGIYQQLAAPWDLNHPEHPQMLTWAARLHEIGVMVAHSQYQKHGAYLLRNADLAGFSRQEQMVLAALVLGHRRKFPMQEFLNLPKAEQNSARHLCVILRLAVLLHRGRSAVNKHFLNVTADSERLALCFPNEWLARHPLTQLELEQEAERLATAKIILTFC
ncbi:Ppx/GppA phosphatase family protein [Chromatium okenii]|uniref:Exopolyphosphatase n=1 Tax=Chromatium okenii TaxID=61644 RepID=A0A2S7XNP6_9GAMM|nr:Ppx/GppA phosphatase family protein [Chromatium okenii]MBV5309945.1 Ppx/GppA family phosphatase [Chromatium okenii]PQJ95001.1 exopolyphosphatase [Chromatium okenii]